MHLGRPRPLTLAEELDEVRRASGVDAMLERHATLRERFYGRGAYDFSEGVLNQLGYQLLGEGDTRGAIEVFRRNADLFAASANAWDSLAEAYMNAGDLEHAAQYYHRSLGLDPSNTNAKRKLLEIEADEDG